MENRGRLFLRLTKNQCDGKTPIKINNRIKKQLLFLTSYSLTCTAPDNQATIEVLNVDIIGVNNGSFLIDNTDSINTMSLDLTNNDTQTFVPNCTDYYNMNDDINEVIKVRCTDVNYNDLPDTSIITLKFLYEDK